MGGRWQRTCGRKYIFLIKAERDKLCRFFVHKRIIPAVKRVEFLSDMMSYIILRGRWCHFIALNIHGSTEVKTDDVRTASMMNWNVCLKNSLNNL
jgi:Ni,Fe-hydrogenase III large subunit